MGLTLLLVTAVLYALFVLGMFGLFVTGKGVWLLLYAVTVLALGFGAVNIKDYFAFGLGSP